MQIFNIIPTPLTFAILILAFLLLLLEIFTIGYAFIRQLQDKQRDSLAKSTRKEILQLVRTEQPPYDEFCSNLTRSERTTAKQTIESLIEHTSEPTANNLRHLGKELGMHQDAVTRLNGKDWITRLNGLTTLSLLCYPPSVSDVRTHCLDNAVLRGAGAHALITTETTSGYRDALTVLYHESSNQLSVLGMNVVYTIGIHNPKLLFDELADRLTSNSGPELVQTLLVVSELDIDRQSVGEIPSWITTALAADDDQLRAAAVRSLGAFDPAVSQQSDPAVVAALSDSAQQVRIAAAQVIDRWDDNEALLHELARALTVEPNSHVRQSMVRTLVHQGHDPQRPLPLGAMKSWKWGLQLAETPMEESV